MMSSTHEMTDAQALAAVLAEDAGRQAGDHPALDELADYLAGDLAPEVETRIQNHLVACRTCTTQLLDLETLTELGPQTAEGATDLAVAAGWREQKNRIADLESSSRRQRTMRWVSAVAASFFVATVGLSVHTTQLRQTVARLEAPEINVPIIHLDSSTSRSSGASESTAIEDHHRSIELRIDPVGSDPFPSYGIEIVTASGSPIWSRTDIELDDLGFLRLRMSRSLLQATEYEVRLYGQTKDHRERLGTFPLQIRSE